MKRITLAFSLLVLCALGLSETEVLVVKVQTTALRSEPRFFSAVKANLKAGDQVEKLTSREGWFQVKVKSGVTGWVHSSAVQPRVSSLVAMAQGPKTQASMSEVALASKGFNQQVEASYREKHPQLDYTWVDRMLTLRVSAEAIEEFLRQGLLGEWQGGK